MIGKAALWLSLVALVLGLATYAAFQLSPWPGAFVIRQLFDRDARKANAALAARVPSDAVIERNLAFGEGALAGKLDVFFPRAAEGTDKLLPTIVWAHGGAWISGSSALIANYLRILASCGFTVVGVDYTIAPEAIYPTPVVQVNEALALLTRDGASLHVDANALVLAGDSAGSQIVAEVANLAAVPSYAEAVGVKPKFNLKQIKGLVLFCGAYDIGLANLDGSFGWFLRAALWSYSGEKDFLEDRRFATLSVRQYVTADFPPSFISAGNSDPLRDQSIAFAKTLQDKGVSVETLFFPADYDPPLPHEYQLNLDSEAGREALERAVAFIAAVTRH